MTSELAKNTMGRQLQSSMFGITAKCFEQDFIKNARGQKLCCRYWPLSTKDEPRALVFICHGFSEHLGYYDEVGARFAKNKILAFGHDLVGHGLSEGKRAYVDSVDYYVDDVRLHCEEMVLKYPELPLFIVAHSMGGMIALRAVLNHPKLFKGMVLQGPLIIPGFSVGPIDARLNPHRTLPVRLFLSALDWINPELILGKVFMKAITRDPDMARHLEACNLRWSQGCKVRLLLAFLTCLEENLSLANAIDVPFLVLHGTSDSLCNINGSQLLFEQARAADKQFVPYPDAVHHLYLEIPEVRNDAVARTIDWVSSRIPKPAEPQEVSDSNSEDDPEKESDSNSEDDPKEESDSNSEDDPKEESDSNSEDDPKEESDSNSEDDPKEESDSNSEDDPKEDSDSNSEDDPKEESDSNSEDDPKEESDLNSEDDPKEESDSNSEDDPEEESDLNSEGDPKEESDSNSEDDPEEESGLNSEDDPEEESDSDSKYCPKAAPDSD